ncbi:MAG TPA: phosphodiester glycosidase family protein, partial [Candidatus Limnocylindrales bacterium]|nr:phosphodiester glycosidase family protein [Candidatus Limnocylindrales bacterium]
MRVLFGAAVALCAVITLPPAQAQGALVSGFVESSSEQISAGVVYQSGSVLAGLTERQVDVVTIDADAGASIRLNQAGDYAFGGGDVIEQALADSRDGNRILATVNGSLFNAVVREGEYVAATGLGFNVSDGELVNAGNPRARPEGVPGFGLDAFGAPFIGVPHPTLTLTLPGDQIADVNRVNEFRFADQVALFTPRFGATTETDTPGDEFVIEGFSLPFRQAGTHTGTITEVRRGMSSTPIGAGQVVLSVGSTAPSAASYATLEQGNQISFTMAVEEPWATATQAVGGKDMLVVNGQNIVVDPVENRARSAIGINAGGDVMVLTVDTGTTARGLNLIELADLMIERGAVQAMNLDGGTSSQMAVRRPGDVDASFVNALAEPTRRRVANALQVVSTAPDGPLASLLVNPVTSRATIGSTVAFVAKGQDADLNGITVDPALVDWNVATMPGTNPGDAPVLTHTETGITLAPTAAGEFDVNARLAELTATADLSVSPDVTPPTLAVTGLSLEDASSVALIGAGLTLSWSAADDGQVARIQVQRKVGTSSWRNLAVADPSATSLTSRVALTKPVRFRARAFDVAGHASPWAVTGRVRVVRVDDTDSRVKLTDEWTRTTDPSALGGAFLRSTTAGATATLTLKALQMQAVG